MSWTDRTNLINGAAAFACVAASAVLAIWIPSNEGAPRPVRAELSAIVDRVVLADGRHAVRDATATLVPLAEYRRIISGNTVADWLLVELCEPGRIAAVTQRSAASAPWHYRFGGLATLASLGDLESVLALQPDLIIAASFGDPRRLARLREAGVQVFDLGQMDGVPAVVRAMRVVGALIGRADRAELLARRYQRSLAAVAADVAVAPAERPRAVYVSPYGNKLFGGTTGSNYHDILVHAGLRDAAADRHQGWPEYSAETVLALDPDLVVTRTGMAELLCRTPGLGRLRACRTPNAIVELDPFILDDPGLGILEATEALHRAVYGSSP